MISQKKNSPFSDTILTLPKNNTFGFSTVTLGRMIGNGAFASVYLCKPITEKKTSFFNRLLESTKLGCQRGRSNEDKKACAVKCIDKYMYKEIPKLEESVKREIRILKMCSNSSFIVKMLFHYETSQTIYIGLEYLSGGDLHYRLSTKGISQNQTLAYLSQVAKGLFQLHSFQVVYHDLKPENICISADGQVKLVDFGLAYILDESHFNPRTNRREIISSGGTIEYCAPEIFTRTAHAFESDWWSFGVLTFELLSGGNPYYHDGTPHEQCEYICSSASFHRNRVIYAGSDAESFVSMFLQKDQTKRFGYYDEDLQSILQHPLFMRRVCQ